MVIQKAVDNLKDKSSDEKKVVAGGIAIAVVAVLFVGWAILFLKKLQRGGELQQLGGGAQDEFLGSSIREAQDALMRDFSDIDELRATREQLGQQYQQDTVQQNPQQTDTDVFGSPDSIEQ
ncbi:hypothetical protein A3B35_00605 [Candidatus Kaiserbacteria bacterium RIFCSPLOWO2_01_FULL_54_24]|uniref:Uncharacterized protein n=1 Tax=Candidatus Kaiserbacteria bacterium RIFCSPLOWO2_01_FULL_54_24 TaxID=1798515 RepID=A0A1F6EW69_9BACT|nr:MAG: hypothetical protein A3B35_00605 [Candidatus Kaiserbacteria bacterium RIFCSPLOWO2_01_FULL_54_24]